MARIFDERQPTRLRCNELSPMFLDEGNKRVAQARPASHPKVDAPRGQRGDRRRHVIAAAREEINPALCEG